MRRSATLAVIALAAAIAPLPALAAPANTQSYFLKTREYDTSTAGEYDGNLRLRVTPAGLVSGSYITSEGHISHVVGGLAGTKIWLDLGASGPSLRRFFQGTFADGALDASVSRGPDIWKLEGTPAG
jgi:hypothetical protein